MRKLDLRVLEKSLDKADCEDSLLDFVKTFWHVVDPKQPFQSGWVVEAICAHLEAVSRGELKRLLINVWPGTSKSSLLDIFLPAWEWGPRNRPAERYICASYSAHLTERDNSRFLRVVTSPLYREFWGDRVHLVKTGVQKVENRETGWKIATSVGGVGTGERGTRVLIDDPNNVNDVESKTMRDATNFWFREVMPDRLASLTDSAVVVIQQRTHEDDVSGQILEHELGYEHLQIPAEYDPARHCRTSIGWEDPRTEAGELGWPERFPRSALDEQRRIKGPFAYCTPAESPILMADLSLKPIGTVRAGDEIIGWTDGDTTKQRHIRRRLIRAKVLSVSRSLQPVVKMTLDSGQTVRCTADHRWYTGRNDSSHQLYKPARLGSTLMRVCDPEIPTSRFLAGEERVVSIEPDGTEEVFGLETETGNYVVWGIASANSAQYDQAPVPRGGGIIKRDWWLVWPPPDYVEQYTHEVLDKDTGKMVRRTAFPRMEFICASVDTAYGEKEENDWNACTVWGIWRDRAELPRVMLMEAWRERLQLRGLVHRVADTCRRRKVDALLIEAKTRGKDLADEIRRLVADGSFSVHLLDPGAADKTARLTATQAFFSDGLIYAPDRKWANAVIDEVASFPKGKNDDFCDSASQALLWMRRAGLLKMVPEAAEERLEKFRYDGPKRLPYPV